MVAHNVCTSVILARGCCVTVLANIRQYTEGEHFSSWSRAAYWQHYVMKMSKHCQDFLEHR